MVKRSKIEAGRLFHVVQGGKIGWRARRAICFSNKLEKVFLEDCFQTRQSSSSIHSVFELSIQQQKVDPVFNFLSTYQALNLATAHHLRGIELLQSDHQQRRRCRRWLSNALSSLDDDDREDDDIACYF